MFTYRTKLVAGFAVLFLVLLIANTVDHFYISKIYPPITEIDKTSQKRYYIANLQITLERLLMPPNDYLIRGDPAEKAEGMNLIKQMDSLFETAAKMALTEEEHVLLEYTQTRFDEIRAYAKEIFAIEDPVGNQAGSKLMERMEDLALEVNESLGRIRKIYYEKTVATISRVKLLYKLESKIYWISVLFSVVFATVIGLFIYRAVKELQGRTKQIESAKREWEATFDAIKDVITIQDKDYNIIRANKTALEMFKTNPETLIGRKCYEVFHGASEPHPLCPHKETVEKRVLASVEVDEPRLGGTFLKTTYPIINEKGELYAVVHTVKDITEIKKANQRVREEAEVNKAVLTIAKLIGSTMDEETILQEVVQVTPTLVKCDKCAIFPWNHEQKAFLPRAYYGFEDSLLPMFKTLRIQPGHIKAFDEVNKQKTTIVIEDPINSPLIPLELANTFNAKAIIITPIISRANVIGIFGIGHTKEPYKFSHREIAVVEGIAAQTGIALENTKLYRESITRMMELEHRIETIQVMHEIDKNVLSTINRNEILETAAFLVRRVIPSDRVTVVTVDKEARCFKYIAGFGIEFPKGLIVPFEDTNATDVLRTGRLISRPNIPLEKNLLPLDRKFMEQGFHSDVRLPIKARGETVAILNIGSHTIAAYTPEHIATAEKLAAQVGVALEHAKLFSDLQELLVNTVKTLASTIDAKSPWTRGHSERITELSMTTGKKMGLTQKQIDDLRFACLLHDIGKIGTAEHIIDKPGRLTDEEFAIVKEHPSKGAEILKPIKQFADIISGVAQHHERVDGTGYPLKLKNGNIHIFGKIIAVSDAYDAMVSARPYRKALDKERAMAEIKRCAGTQFDTEVVEAFLKAVGDRQ